jgi:hypothetical protein
MNGAINRVLNLYKTLRKSIATRVASRPPFPFICGDYVWVWDPIRGLHDLAGTPFTYAGQLVWPVAVRVMEMTWPIVEGMSVWLDNTHQGGDVTDLTPFVEWEEGDTTLSVGSLPRRLGYLPRPAS